MQHILFHTIAPNLPSYERHYIDLTVWVFGRMWLSDKSQFEKKKKTFHKALCCFPPHPCGKPFNCSTQKAADFSLMWLTHLTALTDLPVSVSHCQLKLLPWMRDIIFLLKWETKQKKIRIRGKKCSVWVWHRADTGTGEIWSSLSGEENEKPEHCLEGLNYDSQNIWLAVVEVGSKHSNEISSLQSG